MMIPMFIGRSKIGKTKLRLNIILLITVDPIHSQIWRIVYLFSDSSDTSIPKPSENASAKAIINIPVKIIPFELVLLDKPINRPSVVIIPEVVP